MDGTREALLHEVMHETLNQERHDFLGSVMTEEAMVGRHTVNGVFLTRPIPRFGIHQGFKVNSVVELVMKTRCIDDAHRPDVNTDTLLRETLVMSSFKFITRVRGHICVKIDDNSDFDLLMDLEDTHGKYKNFGNISEYVSVVPVFNPTSRSVEYRELFGLSMYNSSSPVQFSCIPEDLSDETQIF